MKRKQQQIFQSNMAKAGKVCQAAIEKAAADAFDSPDQNPDPVKAFVEAQAKYDALCVIAEDEYNMAVYGRVFVRAPLRGGVSLKNMR